MYRWVAAACIGAILVVALIPGAGALCIALPVLAGVAAACRETASVQAVRQPSVSLALIALLASGHMPRASLPPVRS